MAKKIKQFFVDGQQAKAAKSALDDDVAGQLLPVAEATDVGKVLTVGETGIAQWDTASSSDFPTPTNADMFHALGVIGTGGANVAYGILSPLVVTMSGTNNKLSKKWDIINAYFQAGCTVLLNNDRQYCKVLNCNFVNDDGAYCYYLTAIFNGQITTWRQVGTSGSAYPVVVG